MQLVKPIDIEDALRIDISLEGVSCFAPPAPDNLLPDSVCFTVVGGASMFAVGHEYDVSVDCWAMTDAAALDLANTICGEVCSLPLKTLESGRHYVTSDVNAIPYLNPDPLRPTLPRATFRATVGIRGESII